MICFMMLNAMKGLIMSNQCRPPKVIRSKPRVYTERDVGRIVAYARNDGADDILLIAYILQSFGLRQIQCFAFKILDILNTGVFLGAIVAVLKGALDIVKGIKILSLGKKSKITLNLIELLLPKKYNQPLAAFLIYVGSIEVALGSITIFITAIANNIQLYQLMQGVCEEEIAPLKVTIKPIDTSSLLDDIKAAVTAMQAALLNL